MCNGNENDNNNKNDKNNKNNKNDKNKNHNNNNNIAILPDRILAEQLLDLADNFVCVEIGVFIELVLRDGRKGSPDRLIGQKRNDGTLDRVGD